ncbi:hypothetical protein B0H10DRAFT_1953789 [Mycena sp. CBHHK59/15]|nr:hypothetical protein B0H10DRAFT_1953789 [Mycena sp. CBHHK59/15]
MDVGKRPSAVTNLPRCDNRHQRYRRHNLPGRAILPDYVLNPASPPEKRKKQPPACDSCKIRRVLCHPQPNSAPCPRCVEKGGNCTTTPVTQGRPPKKTREISLSGSPVSAESPVASGSGTPYNAVVTRASSDVSPPPVLSPELVHHLFESTLSSTGLRSAMRSPVSWQIDLLPPQARVLAHCFLALTSSISFHSAILGPGPQPESFDDRAVLYRGADLRGYGLHRAPMCRALHEQAFGLAGAAGVLLEPSEDNAASCFILELLDRRNEGSSRPWAGAYISHMRTLATTWDDLNVGACRPLWTGFLMVEALSATAMRESILITQNDQLLMTASEPMNLLQLVQTCGPPAAHMIFNIIYPCPERTLEIR